ncbi:MAG: hypothetical protein AB7F99_07390 [Vicinamibacterales bacterium]
MRMGRQFVARFAGPSASTLSRSVVATLGILGPLAAFGWFVMVAPAVVSFAVAVGAAMAWCAWLEKHPNAPAHVEESTAEAVTDATRGRLSVNVLATTHDGTRCALGVAKRLTGSLDAQVVLLLPRLASSAGGFDPASQERSTLVDKYRALAADVGVHAKVLFCVCHRYDDVVHQMLGRSSLIVLGGRKRISWPTREERLVSRLTKEGYPVVFAQVGAAPASSPLMDTARS